MNYISRVKKIILISFFLASYMILKRLLIVKLFSGTYSFAFVPIMLSAIMLGIKSTVLIEFLGDILGWLMFPRGGFFIGFTLSSVLAGFIHGLFLYKKDRIVADKAFLLKLIISVLMVAIIVSLGLNTFWSFYMIKDAAKVRFSIKAIRQFVLVPFKVVTIYCTVKLLEERLNNVRCAET